AALDILWGAKALVVEEDGELRQRRGKLDVADAAYLLCAWRCSDRSGISPVVVQLELDILWQEEQHCARLPTADEDSVLHRRIANYCNKEKSARCRMMRAAYPADVESIQELKLDCLEASDDGDGCVKWRSDVERQMMQPIPGRREGDVVKSCFAPLGAVLFAGDAPTVDVDMDGDTAIGGGEEEGDVEKPLQRFQCRLCDFGAILEKEPSWITLEQHSGGADESRALIEYRKK
ncbi:unnamed protein product, partial [Durusdinium trenchii]